MNGGRAKRSAAVFFWRIGRQKPAIAASIGCGVPRRRCAVINKAAIELLVRRAGLEKALAEFPDDVAAAAEQASASAARIKIPGDPRAEPWPPMKVEGGR